MSTPPIPGLSDEEMRVLLDYARPLQLVDRARFLELVGERLRGFDGELGTGSITRIAREAQLAVHRPPTGPQDKAPLLKSES